MKLISVKTTLRRVVKFRAYYEGAIESSLFYEIGNINDLVDMLIEALCDET